MFILNQVGDDMMIRRTQLLFKFFVKILMKMILLKIICKKIFSYLNTRLILHTIRLVYFVILSGLM